MFKKQQVEKEEEGGKISQNTLKETLVGIRNQYRHKRNSKTILQNRLNNISFKTQIPPIRIDVSVGFRVVWAGGKNSLVERIWPGGNVPVVISNRSELKSCGSALNVSYAPFLKYQKGFEIIWSC